MRKADYEDLALLRQLYLRDNAAKVRFPRTILATENLSLPHHSVTLNLIATFNQVIKHPGKFIGFLPNQRQEFIFQLTSSAILPPIKYFSQYDSSDFTSLYCTLIDTFQLELGEFNLSAVNEVHLEWMLRVRDFNVKCGIQRPINANY